MKKAVCSDVRGLRAAGATLKEIMALTGLSGGQINYRLYAQGQENRLPRKGRQERRCMCCGRTFPSEGAHHRLCDRCRKETLTPFDVPHGVLR